MRKDIGFLCMLLVLAYICYLALNKDKRDHDQQWPLIEKTK